MISEKLVYQAIHTGVIKDKDHDLYFYAFHALISYTCSFATMFVVALLMHRFIESVIFIFFFYSLRIFAGGFHEKSELRCYIVSTIMFISMITVDKIGSPGIQMWTNCVVLVASVIVIFLKAPVESKNKPLSTDEVRKYRKITRVIVAVDTIGIALAFALNCHQIYLYYAVAGIVMTAILLVIPTVNGY
jgi:accessory gene regulator B